MQEPTPTIEEFVHSFVPTNWFTPTLENLLYWEIKAAALVVPTATRIALLMRGGMAFGEAAYLATDTVGWYRVVSKARTAVGVLRYSPLIATTYLGVTEQHQAMSEFGSGVRGTGTMGVAPSMHLKNGKPWWQ